MPSNILILLLQMDMDFNFKSISFFFSYRLKYFFNPFRNEIIPSFVNDK